MKKKAARAKKKRKVNPIPAGYHAVTPYLSIRGAAQAIEFYKKAFGAAEVMRMPGPDGKLGHAEIRIGDSRVMLSDEYPQMAFIGPQTRGGSTVHIHLYVRDPFGHVWHLATHKEDLSMAELRRRAEKAAKEMGG